MDFFLLSALVLVMLFGLYALTVGRHLKTGRATAADVQGKFTLFLYGCRSRGDFGNVAILDREDDAYSFEIMAPDSSYTVRKGLTAQAALQEAEQFVRCNIEAGSTRLRRILGPASAAVGFEVMPLYPVIRFGKEDVVDVQYTVKDRTIAVHIRLDPSVERAGTG